MFFLSLITRFAVFFKSFIACNLPQKIYLECILKKIFCKLKSDTLDNPTKFTNIILIIAVMTVLTVGVKETHAGTKKIWCRAC